MENNTNNSLAIFESPDGTVKVDVRVLDETVWLSLSQISQLFNRDKSVVAKHIKNVFKEEELEKNTTVANFATVQKEGNYEVTRQIEHFNLDVIISVGYRVNSKRGVQFRKWASSVLKQYLLNGYSINKEKLVEAKIKELQASIDLISKTLVNNNLVVGAGAEVVEIIKAYSKTWNLLIKYDEDNLQLPSKLHSSAEEIINYKYAKDSIENF